MSRMVRTGGGRMVELDEDSGEPVLSRAAWTALASALLAVAAAWGLPLSGAQETAVVALVAVAGPLVAGLLARRRAWSGASVAEVLDVARGDR